LTIFEHLVILLRHSPRFPQSGLPHENVTSR
jgi:hypothetical protein